MRITRHSLIALVLAAAGVGFFAAGRLHNAVQWILVREALTLAPGAGVEASFTADLDAPCEIEIEVEDGALSESWREEIFAQDRASQLDVRWTISQRGENLATGDSREYLYVRGSNASSIAHAVFQLLNIEGHKARRGTLARGVGRIDCAHGETYSVSALVEEVGSGLPEIQGALVVRVGRVVGDRRLTESYPLFGFAVALLGLSAVLFGLDVWKRMR